MFYGLKDRLKRSKFDFQVRDILHTPPARIVANAPAVILTQLQHKDVRMFLLASKSFMAQVPVSHVHILSDGTLTADDMAVLSAHIPQVSFLQLADHRSSLCPQGACWERLLSIAELVKQHYVIQLDGDTLALGDISEVAANVADGAAFTLGTWDDQEIESMATRCVAAKAAMTGANPHVQLLAESSFDQFKDYASLRYVKGCAGFAGFSRGSFTREQVESLSQEMEAAIGRRWHEWGSEQVMSNIVVANIPGARVLPHPKYSSCENLDNYTPAFIHFIGYCRFNKGAYARFGRQVIARLRNA
ncbi:MAG TPA: hypothetical protein PLW86_02275 [Rhodocyclaceae bacterium]|nr:hypothetical protein [Rhodocyclaceae bacterium]